MEQIALQQKLHNPVRQADETFEVYQQRRHSSNELNKLSRKGRLVHRSVWYTQGQDKEGNLVPIRHHKTFVKPKDN